jgi:type I restriction enzyme R subunit
LLEALKREKLVLDWRKTQTRKAIVRDFIDQFYEEKLPETYDDDLFDKKCDLTFMHVYDAYGVYGSEVRV